MLIQFQLQNFRSFRDEQRLDLVASADRTHEKTNLIRTGMKLRSRVSKTAVIFGANASGKTNLMHALATFRELVVHSTALSNNQFAALYTPFKLANTAHRATTFEIDLLLDRVRYRYLVSYDAQRIQAERLLVYKTGKAQRWFERHYNAAADKNDWAPFSPYLTGPREMWRKATRYNALFLTTAALLHCKQLASVLHWFKYCLQIVLPSDPDDYDRISLQLQNRSFKKRIIKMLQAVDIRVDDVRVVHRDLSAVPSSNSFGERAYPLNVPPSEIEFLYQRTGTAPLWLANRFEAAGTLQLFKLFGFITVAIDQGQLLVIDEFDSSLHPLIARYLLQLVNNRDVARRGAQLLLTSHNTALMDLEILRRDEIWLMSVDASSSSGLKPLSRFSPRKRESVGEWYLQGRYGSIPKLQPKP